MISDPIADLLIRIKNGYMSRTSQVQIPYSNFKEELLNLLKTNGYVADYKIDEKTKLINVSLLYKFGQPAMNGVKRISKPGLRRYGGVKYIRKLRKNLGHVFLSTPKGLKTHNHAIKENLGGEILCLVW